MNPSDSNTRRLRRVRPSPPGGLVRRLRATCRGATAMEFAIVFPVFMLFVGMIMENGLLLFTQSTLDNAVLDASRAIRTGQVQLAGGGATPFANALCGDVNTLIPCAALQYNVQSAATFSLLSTMVQVTASGSLINQSFTPGGPGQDVLVQVAYSRPYLMPWLAMFGVGDHSILVSTLAFQNERYQ